MADPVSVSAPVTPAPTPINTPVPWYKDNENQKDIATALGVAMELFNAYQPHIPPGVSVGVGILLRAGLNYFGGSK